MLRTPSYPPADPVELAEAAHLVALYADRIQACRSMATNPHPTDVDADAVLRAADQLEAACEDYRTRWYPDAGRVVVGLYQVIVLPADGDIDHAHTVCDLHDTYRAA